MAEHVADPSKVISPKVIAQVGVSFFLVVLLGAINAITPDLFAGLGAWGPVLYAAVAAAGGAIAGYVKTDPLRKPGP